MRSEATIVSMPRLFLPRPLILKVFNYPLCRQRMTILGTVNVEACIVTSGTPAWLHGMSMGDVFRAEILKLERVRHCFLKGP
jgi:hypothetical protein